MTTFSPQHETDDMIQLLTPEGERVEHEHFSWTGTDTQIFGFLRDMTLARRFDDEAHALQRHGELGLWPPLRGQEAAQVGSARMLGPHDVVFPSYREHAVALCLGVPPADMLGLFRGSHGGERTGNRRFRHSAIVIGAQALHATGYAMGLQFDGMVGNPNPSDNAAVVAYHGDGASSQGDVNEAYVFAASYNAPVVFFCQNNQWAISEPISRQTRIPLYQRAQGFGFPGIQVDGNDVLAVAAVTEWALGRAHRGEGPTFIEAFTYRMGAHTTSDDPTKYRLSEEDEHWRFKDPLERVRAYLIRHGQVSQDELNALQQEAEEFGAHIRQTARTLPDRSMDEMFQAVYAEPNPHLEAQRRSHQAWVDSLEVPA